ncbi:hypothetical protein ACH4ZU_29175 [Streptomyces sp. NPDC020472]|uniref:hypothetical protein n=1 Tax=Streptomyces sp. NPDC020472 TaxID=3365075 RepID=UPI0037A15F0A
MTTDPFIRPYRPSDRTALGEIRVRTAHEGGDASHLHPDPELMPTTFASPYVELEPDFAPVPGQARDHAPTSRSRTPEK